MRLKDSYQTTNAADAFCKRWAHLIDKVNEVTTRAEFEQEQHLLCAVGRGLHRAPEEAHDVRVWGQLLQRLDLSLGERELRLLLADNLLQGEGLARLCVVSEPHKSETAFGQLFLLDDCPVPDPVMLLRRGHRPRHCRHLLPHLPKHGAPGRQGAPCSRTTTV